MTVTAMFLGNEDGDIATLRYAAEIARLLVKPLRAVCAIPDPSNVYAYSTPEFAIGVSTGMTKQILEEQDAIKSKTKSAFDATISNGALPGERANLVYRPGYPPDVAAQEALLSDVLVFPRAASTSGHAFSGACEHVMMDCALPILIAGTEPKAQGPVVIAWDASDQAARSLRLHLSVFRHVGPVIIAQSSEGLKSRGDATSPEALSAWLAGQGVESSIEQMSGSAGEGLLQLADRAGAAMIVSGAYGHSRAGEYLFGGATRTLLHANQAPALALCH
ncbi:MAG: universal stress protein [Pseudomonadota bacterium]